MDKNGSDRSGALQGGVRKNRCRRLQVTQMPMNAGTQDVDVTRLLMPWHGESIGEDE